MSDNDVFRVALPGFDVHRGKIEQMVLDNRYPSPKIDTQAVPSHAGVIYLNWQSTAGVNYDVTQVVYSFPHRLSQTPIVIASYKWDNGTNVYRGILPFQYGALGIITIDADEKNINLKYYSLDTSIPALAVGPFTMQIRFYVMADAGL